jgi:hypothetical protein
MALKAAIDVAAAPTEFRKVRREGLSGSHLDKPRIPIDLLLVRTRRQDIT